MTEVERLINEGFINEDFLKEEVRCDYLVSSHMKKVWAIQLDLLNQLFSVCKEYNLQVWAAYGTMLGAIRHKGFIPWDDDADVYMPRDDYEKLLIVASKAFMPPYLIRFKGDGDWVPYARLCNNRTNVKEKHNLDKVLYDGPIFIDIFPLDGAPDSKVALDRKMRRVVFLWRLHYYWLSDRGTQWKWYNKAVHHLIHWPISPINKGNTITLINKVASSTKYQQSHRAANLVSPPYPIEKELLEKEWLKDTIWMPFENIRVPVPRGYENILHSIYGDYTEFPPLEKRGLWHSNVYDPETPSIT